MPEGFDVVVAGAGIGGTAFALRVAREGVRVALVERAIGRQDAPRPEILWAPTMAGLDKLGVGERIRDPRVAIPLRGIEARASGGGRLLRLEPRDDGASVAWGTDPGATRALLLEAALATGRVEHFPGVEVKGLLREDGRVAGVVGAGPDGERTVRARFAVGDDGGRSIVRHAAGIGLEAAPFPVEFILCPIARPEWLPADEGRAFLDPDGFRRGMPVLLLVPMGAERVGVVVGARHGTFAHAREGPRGAFEEGVRKLLPGGLDLPFSRPFPEGFVKAVRPVGHAEAYGRSGVALVGDAAHPVSPVGGQGANMALADAAALADAVLPALARGAVPGEPELRAYEARRRPANDRSIAFSRRAARGFDLLWRAPLLARGVPWLLQRLDGSPAWKARLVASVSHAFESGASGPG